jgi:hypothetical protein
MGLSNESRQKCNPTFAGIDLHEIACKAGQSHESTATKRHLVGHSFVSPHPSESRDIARVITIVALRISHQAPFHAFSITMGYGYVLKCPATFS